MPRPEVAVDVKKVKIPVAQTAAACRQRPRRRLTMSSTRCARVLFYRRYGAPARRQAADALPRRDAAISRHIMEQARHVHRLSARRSRCCTPMPVCPQQQKTPEHAQATAAMPSVDVAAR